MGGDRRPGGVVVVAVVPGGVAAVAAVPGGVAAVRLVDRTRNAGDAT